MRGYYLGRAATTRENWSKRPSSPGMVGRELVTRGFHEAKLHVDGHRRSLLSRRPDRRHGRTERSHVVAYDYGMKCNILRSLVGSGLPRHRRARRRPPPRTCWRSSPTASSSPTAPAIPSRCTYADRAGPPAVGKRPDLRHLPRPSDPRPGLRRQDLQAEVRPPRRPTSP